MADRVSSTHHAVPLCAVGRGLVAKPDASADLWAVALDRAGIASVDENVGDVCADKVGANVKARFARVEFNLDAAYT